MGIVNPCRSLGRAASLGQSSRAETRLFTTGITMNPTLLLMGFGLLALVAFSWGSSPERVEKSIRRTGKRKRRKARRKAIGAKIEKLKKEKSGLGWF